MKVPTPKQYRQKTPCGHLCRVTTEVPMFEGVENVIEFKAKGRDFRIIVYDDGDVAIIPSSDAKAEVHYPVRWGAKGITRVGRSEVLSEVDGVTFLKPRKPRKPKQAGN